MSPILWVDDLSTRRRIDMMNSDLWRSLLEVLNDWRRVDADPGGRLAVRALDLERAAGRREDPAALHFRLVEDLIRPEDSRSVRVALLTVARLGEVALALPIPENTRERRDTILRGLVEAIEETARVEREAKGELRLA
jgi:hypothetical protein